MGGQRWQLGEVLAVVIFLDRHNWRPPDLADPHLTALAARLHRPVAGVSCRAYELRAAHPAYEGSRNDVIAEDRALVEAWVFAVECNRLGWVQHTRPGPDE
jgi:hypothetical protein